MSNVAVSLKPRDDTHALNPDNLRTAWARVVPRGAGGNRAAGGAALERGSGGAIDAGRQSDQMASRAHDVVLRAVPAGAERARLSGVSTSASRICSIPITSPPDRAMRGRGAGWSRGRMPRKSAAYRAHVDAAVARLIGGRG